MAEPVPQPDHSKVSRCRECGYDLTGVDSGICPECGAGFFIGGDDLLRLRGKLHAAGDVAARCRVCGGTIPAGAGKCPTCGCRLIRKL